MEYVIRNAQPDADVCVCKRTDDALVYAEKMHPQAAFISVQHKDGRGYFLIKKLKLLAPRTNVIAVSETYRFEAELMKLRISGYITEGITREKVLDEMEHLRYREPVLYENVM